MTSKVNVTHNNSSSSEDEYHSDSSVAGDISGVSDDDSQDATEVTGTMSPPRKADSGTSAVANVMAKILGKTAPQKNTAILSKGVTDKTLQKKRKAKEDQKDAEEGQVVKREKTDGSDPSLTTTEAKADKLKRSVWENMGRVKPDVLARENERLLQRTATRGVVQLFNAVKKQQKLVEERLAEAGGTEYKKDKVMQTMTKGRFMDVLKGTAATSPGSLPGSTRVKTQKRSAGDVEVKQESKENPSWSVLRDDFMMGAKMKDWDKEISDSEGPRESGESCDDSDPDS